MIDLQQLRKDAATISELHTGSMAGDVADQLLFILDHPRLIIPAGYYVGKKPELMGKGISDRRGGG